MIREFYKKIDKSFFDGKFTVPNEYIDTFTDLSEMQNNKSRDIKIIFKKKEYEGKFCFVHQSSGRLVLQIAYSNNLCKLLKQEFIQTFLAIESQKLTNRNKKFQTNLLGGNQEIVKIAVVNESCIEMSSFVKIETPFDNMFKRLIELNVFGLLSKESKADRFIIKNTKWFDIRDLSNHVDTPYVVYYLIDEDKKQIYIGSARRLGDRVKAGRKEIPGWNKFMYEVVHPNFHAYLKEIEYHSIMNFAKFFKNNGKRTSLSISEYTLVNKDYKYYRD